MSLEVNITKKLDGFTLRAEFTAGSTATALLGASGCGKSMTLRCIAGIVKPDAGRIVLDLAGEERAGMTVDALLEKFRTSAGKELDNDRILLSDRE